MECDDDAGVGGDRCCYLVGEEDAVWLLRLVLPYVNEVLLNLRSLFSGEPATTMKVGESQRKAPCVCSCEYFRQKMKEKKTLYDLVRSAWHRRASLDLYY